MSREPTRRLSCCRRPRRRSRLRRSRALLLCLAALHRRRNTRPGDDDSSDGELPEYAPRRRYADDSSSDDDDGATLESEASPDPAVADDDLFEALDLCPPSPAADDARGFFPSDDQKPAPRRALSAAALPPRRRASLAAQLRPPEVPAYAVERSLSLPADPPADASDGDAPGEARPPPPKARLWGKLRDAVASPKASPTKSLFDVVRRSLSPPASPASSPVGPGGLANVSGESRTAAGGDGEAADDDDDPPPAPVVAAKPPPPPLEDWQVSRVPVAPGQVPVVHLRL